MSKKPILLTIAGFDSGCGAGVVADVCTARVLGAYGLVAQTCITVQNTTGIRNIFPIPEKIVQEQIEALFEERDPIYRSLADFVVSGENLTLRALTTKIVNILRSEEYV